jgi:hypothetical protein
MTISLMEVLDKLRRFIECDDREVHARRADACGILWVSHGVVVNTRRLPTVLGKGRSWINDHLARIGYVTGRTDVESQATLEVASILGRTRYDAKASTHWTFRAVGDAHATPAAGDDEGSIWPFDVDEWNCGVEGFE